MAMPRMYVEAPPLTPLPFGIFSAATVRDETDPHWQMGGIEYEPDHCGIAAETPAACNPSTQDLEATRGIPRVTGDPFVVYQLFTCKAPGSFDRGAERARASLRAGEQRGVEQAIARMLSHEPGVVDLTPTPGTPVHPVDGIALLEAYAALNYGGVPTVHAGRGTATVLASVGTIERQGVTMQTKLGSLVAAGGGYTGVIEGPMTDPEDPDSTTPAPAGAGWVYITGQVLIERGAVIEVQPTMGLSTPDNDFSALAERPYVAAWECFTAAVLVRTPGYSANDGSAGNIDGGPA